jgi:hypothetical protein
MGGTRAIIRKRSRRSHRSSQPPRFCHESNPAHLIDEQVGDVRTRGMMRFQFVSIAGGAISNPSVSAEKALASRGFFAFWVFGVLLSRLTHFRAK